MDLPEGAAAQANPRPAFTWEEVQEVAARFGNFSLVKNLPSERDQNFLLRDAAGELVVLKINHPHDDLEFVKCQNMAIEYATAAGCSCQRLLRTQVDNEAMVTITQKEGRICQVRVLTYLPGKMLAEEAAVSTDQPVLFAKVGKAVGGVSAALLPMKHAAAHIEDFDWDQRRCEEVICRLKSSIVAERQPLMDTFLEEYRRVVKPLLPELRQSVAHNDGNDYNLVVTADGVGVLDFGDMLYTYTVSDAAICMAYLLFHVPASQPLVESMIPFVRAFCSQCPLTAVELDAVFGLAVMRVCTSVCMSAYQSAKEPDNEYLLISAGPAWKLLERLAAESGKNSEEPRPGLVFQRAVADAAN